MKLLVQLLFCWFFVDKKINKKWSCIIYKLISIEWVPWHINSTSQDETIHTLIYISVVIEPFIRWFEICKNLNNWFYIFDTFNKIHNVVVRNRFNSYSYINWKIYWYGYCDRGIIADLRWKKCSQKNWFSWIYWLLLTCCSEELFWIL